MAQAPDDDYVLEIQGDVQVLRVKAASRAEPQLARQYLEQARTAYRRAAALAPQLPSPWASLGATFAEEGAGDAASGIEALLHAYELAPWHPWVNLNLGRLYLRAGDRESARERLEFVSSLAHSDQLSRTAQELLRQLEGPASQAKRNPDPDPDAGDNGR
jgi:FimV-like protein